MSSSEDALSMAAPSLEGVETEVSIKKGKRGSSRKEWRERFHKDEQVSNKQAHKV